MGARQRDRGGDRGQTTVCDTGHREGDLGVAGQPISGGDGPKPYLHEIGKPARTGRTRRPLPRGQAHPEAAMTAAHPLSRRIRAVLDLRPDAPAVEYDGDWLAWCEIAALARRIESLDMAGGQVGILLRNRPAHIAA